MRQSSVVFRSKGAMLEGVVASPQDTQGRLPGVVVCHPHPLFGGNMDNSVVIAICRALIDEDFVTLRFNFRGVGSSEGSFADGDLEREDVRAAMELVKEWPGVDRGKIGLAGYSFGASMVLAGHTTYKNAKALVFISPPIKALESLSGTKDKRPKLFVSGDRDRLVPWEALKERVDSDGAYSKLALVPGADHSWRGHEEDLAGHVVDFLAEALRS